MEPNEMMHFDVKYCNMYYSLDKVGGPSKNRWQREYNKADLIHDGFLRNVNQILFVAIHLWGLNLMFISSLHQGKVKTNMNHSFMFQLSWRQVIISMNLNSAPPAQCDMVIKKNFAKYVIDSKAKLVARGSGDPLAKSIFAPAFPCTVSNVATTLRWGHNPLSALTATNLCLSNHQSLIPLCLV